jgi:dTDP-3-amino-3,4,6-trideoxy-alpha-D-glucopyranose N,N-dimethyltransferase
MATVYRDGYPDVYDQVMLTRGRDHAAEARVVAGLVRAHRPDAATLLDVACGTGLHLKFLSAEFAEVAGLDTSAEMLAVARERVPGLRTHHADMREVALPDRFDAVTCLFAVPHLASAVELTATTRRLAGHLTPDGVLVVEPWYAPEEFIDGYVSRDVVAGPDGTVVRLSHSTRLDASRIRVAVHYAEARRATGLRHSTETVELSLFTPDEFAAAFEDAGCIAEHVPATPFAWGLWVARPHA